MSPRLRGAFCVCVEGLVTIDELDGIRRVKEPRAARVLWGLAAMIGMLAALLAWILGFVVAPQVSLVSTTLALVIGLGGFWMLDAFKRRWSWILVLLAMPVGFFLPRPAGNSYVIPALACLLSLLLAASGALVGATARRQPKADAEENGGE